MKEKIHITVLTLWVCVLIGVSFAISSRNYKEKVPKLNSAPTETSKFICNTETISESSQATKEYNDSKKKLTEYLLKLGSLGGDTKTFSDPCEWKKWKAKTECNINNVELRGVLNQIKKLQEKLAPYEACQKSLGVTTKDSSKIISGEVTITKKKNTLKWHEWEWTTCLNSKQTRIIECQSDGKEVDDSKCSWTKPSISRICTDSATTVPPTTTNPTATSIWSCRDSDWWNDIYTKWTATNGTVTKTDVCTKKVINKTFWEPNFLHVTECSVANGDECYVDEAVCLTGNELGLVGQWGSGELKNKCLFGCNNWACKKS